MKYIKERNFKLQNNKINFKKRYIFIVFMVIIVLISAYGKLYFQEGIDYYGNFLTKKEINNKKCIYTGKSDSQIISLEFEELSNNNKLIDLEIGKNSYQYILEPGYLGKDIRLFDKSNNNVFEGNINSNTKSILFDNNNLKFKDIIEKNKGKSNYSMENPDPLLLLMISEEEILNIRGEIKGYLGIFVILMLIIMIYIGTLIFRSKKRQ